MDRRDQSEDALVCLFEGGFAGKRPPLFNLHKTASLRVSLPDEIALHLKILSHAISSLQVVLTV